MVRQKVSTTSNFTIVQKKNDGKSIKHCIAETFPKQKSLQWNE